MKIVNHAWLEIAPWEISLPFKTMKNTKIKIRDLVLIINIFTTKMIYFKKKKKVEMPLRKIRKHFSSATMSDYPKLNGFFCACRYFCIKCCSARRQTTINFKGLLYLMCFFALIKVFYVYNNICSIV